MTLQRGCCGKYFREVAVPGQKETVKQEVNLDTVCPCYRPKM